MRKNCYNEIERTYDKRSRPILMRKNNLIRYLMLHKLCNNDLIMKYLRVRNNLDKFEILSLKL